MYLNKWKKAVVECRKEKVRHTEARRTELVERRSLVEEFPKPIVLEKSKSA